MRIIADKPLQLLRTLVNDHLVRVMAPGDDLRWIVDKTQPIPDPARYVAIAPGPPRGSVDLSALDNRVVLHGPDSKPARFDVVAAIGPDMGPAQVLILLTSDGLVVTASETDAARRADGVFQIAGAEIGIGLVTIDQFRAWAGKGIIPGGSSVSSLSVERRGEDGKWHPVDITIDPNAIGLREVRET